ncbi:MAG: type II toxin-antitoxin system RelB/DinJ family antitoxin, partial [Phascolarctobacterium sp.]
LCSELGITMSTAFTIFAKTMVRQQRIPFEVSLSKPNAATIKAIENVEHQENLSQRFPSVKALMEDLNA